MIRADLLALLAAVALTAVFLFAPAGPSREETFRDLGADLAELQRKMYVRPAHKDLLRGTACIPIAQLLLNRAIPAIHSYSRSVACEPK